PQFPIRNGFVARSLPIVVASPCPGYTMVSSGSSSNFPLSERMIPANEPPQRSVRPMLPANSVSPANNWPTPLLEDLAAPESAGAPGTSDGMYRQMLPGVWPGV